MKLRILLVAAICVSSLIGCATTIPLGLTKAEWDAMSPEKQAEYRTLQKIKDNQARQDADQLRKDARSS